MIEIVRTVPTLTVCRQIVLHLLRKELKDAEENTVKSTNEKSQSLDMLKALLLDVPRELGHNAIASSILVLLSKKNSTDNPWSQVTKSCGLLKSIVSLCKNTWYDGQLMINSMLKDYNVNVIDLDIVARIVFECFLLMVPEEMVSESGGSRSHFSSEFATKLLGIKKTILRWYLKSFEIPDAKRQDQFETRKPNPPIFESILDGETEDIPMTGNLKILHCLLFLVQPDSDNLLQFLHPLFQLDNHDDISINVEETKSRAKFCINHGKVVDDDFLRVILEATKKGNDSIGPISAIELIETILYHCRDGKEGTIQIKDLNIVWDLYSLAEYSIKRSSYEEEIPRYVEFTFITS